MIWRTVIQSTVHLYNVNACHWLVSGETNLVVRYHNETALVFYLSMQSSICLLCFKRWNQRWAQFHFPLCSLGSWASRTWVNNPHSEHLSHLLPSVWMIKVSAPKASSTGGHFCLLFKSRFQANLTLDNSAKMSRMD